MSRVYRWEECPQLAALLGPGVAGCVVGPGRLAGDVEQGCWVHRIANVLDKLARSVQPRAKKVLHGIMGARTWAAAGQGIADFGEAYRAKFPKAVATLTLDQDRLLAYFDYLVAHWKHLRTTNAIESDLRDCAVARNERQREHRLADRGVHDCTSNCSK